ncbi:MULTISPECIES: phosphate acetyltransferase [Corallincola]|uniref:Phosphate acetyltransferase n=3 Tax=Corallincola TaxID=1775176 RepID=A0A368NSZ6_9GAMM|nr:MULTISPECIES: phosphate acetyltransferase [Corallincola]RCU52844.1 phosphate acetyltransferase [Corallincola holothuriorum]TAA48003.1 phosphate acetyltransferase [Corallincola spongiicola]TCI03343.1 phosphate acetyltransferase [Corallincola luteus]
MSRTIMLIPIGGGVGLTTISLGMVRALERQGARVGFYKPVAQLRLGDKGPERSTAIINNATSLTPAEPLRMHYAESLISSDQRDVLLEEVVARYQQFCGNDDTVVVEGLVPTRRSPWANRANIDIAKALDAEVVFVATPGVDDAGQLRERVEIAHNNMGGDKNTQLLGVIVNKVGAPVDDQGRTRPDLSEIFEGSEAHSNASVDAIIKAFKHSKVSLLGCIPWTYDLIAPRVKDLADHLNAEVINEGELAGRRLRSVTFCARSVPNMISHFKPGSLLVTSADRPDVIVSACLAAMNGVEIGALLLTGGFQPDASLMELCKPAMVGGLPVILVDTNTWQTSLNLQAFNLEVPTDDPQRIEQVQDYTASHIDEGWIHQIVAGTDRKRKLSPPAFRYKLTELARQANKRIVLPEGTEPRTIKAAAMCAERGIARCVLLGNPDEVARIASQQGVTLGEGVEIIDPLAVREKYIAPMVEMRKHKGLTEVVADEQLEDEVVLGTMMLAQNEVDGLVSGAVHTTAHTIRPPLQLIKTAPGCSLVSSIFFMLLPDQVLVYGDCAINPDPTAEQLADIAIQSADSATAFGIEPKVAMISYSTGTSGTGTDVDKVRLATEIAKQKRPELIIDGPLQYDAAVMENVAKKKAPNSPVAGQATVFIFPDLNTGNTTYKAVQRSADLISIGPMLQGMRKPVNDLSRGALVEDIVYTIALTAIQSRQLDNVS